MNPKENLKLQHFVVGFTIYLIGVEEEAKVLYIYQTIAKYI